MNLPGNDNWDKEEIAELWKRTKVGAAEVAALLAFMGFHVVLRKAATFITPKGWEKSQLVLEATLYVAFFAVYVKLTYRMVAAFYPRLRLLGKKDKAGQA